MLAGKAGANPNEVPYRCFTVGSVPGLTHKYYSLLQYDNNYSHKKFYSTYPWILTTDIW